MLSTYLILTAIITALTADDFNKRVFDRNKNDELHRIRYHALPQYSFQLRGHTNEITQNNLSNNLEMALNKLTLSIERLTEIIKDLKRTFEKTDRIVLEKNTNVTGRRYKRGANSTGNISTATTDKIPTVALLNATDKINEKNEARIDCDCKKVSNGRRSMYKQTSLVKEKLLTYLEDSFHDIEDKVVTLEDVKQLFADVVPYKVGYVVANVDTLAADMRNLREDVRINAKMWGEREILDVYDRLKTSNSLVTSLLHTLRMFSEKGFKK